MIKTEVMLCQVPPFPPSLGINQLLNIRPYGQALCPDPMFSKSLSLEESYPQQAFVLQKSSNGMLEGRIRANTGFMGAPCTFLTKLSGWESTVTSSWFLWLSIPRPSQSLSNRMSSHSTWQLVNPISSLLVFPCLVLMIFPSICSV